MLYRIIIAPDSNGVDWRVAINSEKGTLQDTVVLVRNPVKALAIVEGYLQLFKGTIEIHPGKSSEWYTFLQNSVNEWKEKI